MIVNAEPESQTDRRRKRKEVLRESWRRIEIEKEEESDRKWWWQRENPGQTCCNEQQTDRSCQRQTAKRLTVIHWCVRRKDNLDDDDGEEEDDESYFDENSVDVAAVVWLLDPGDWIEASRPTGRQAVSLGEFQLSVGVITCQSVYLPQQAWARR